MNNTPAASFHHFVWGATADLRGLPRPRARLIILLRYVHVVVRDLTEGDLILRATSLVYTTLLSMVPLLAVSFSLLKAFGVHNQLEPMLLNMLAPLGDRGGEIAKNIIGFVDNMKVGALGTVGLATLFYTVVSVMQKIEQAFNHSWRITTQRTFEQRFSDYLSVIVVGPVLVFAALGVTATVTNNRLVQALAGYEPFGTLLALLSKLIPYLMIIGAFTFIYVFMPNTRVRVRSALTGAVIAGVLWQTTGWAFATFVAGSAQYTAVYSAFAGLFLFMIWMYVAWLVLLIGADIAFYHQHPEYLTVAEREPRLSIREQEALSLAVMKLIAQNHYQGTPAWTFDRLARRLLIPGDLLRRALAPLEHGGLLKRSNDRDPQYLPARPLDATPVSEVLQAVRAAGDQGIIAARLPPRADVVGLMAEAESAAAGVLSQRMLKDLAGT